MSKDFKIKWVAALLLSNLLIIYVSVANMFPEGYTFSGADVRQLFNLPKAIRDLSYTWSSNGMGVFLQYYCQILFYLPLHFIRVTFSLNDSSISLIYFLIYLLGSFWSFYYSLSFYRDTSYGYSYKRRFYDVIFSLIYSLNSYTFYLFYYTWGYSPFSIIYVLAPVIFGATYRFFTSKTIDKKNPFNFSNSVFLF